MAEPRWSVAVILSRGGAVLDARALGELPLARIVRAEFAAGERAACAALTLEHACSMGRLTDALRPWAGARGWSITIAPLVRGG